MACIRISGVTRFHRSTDETWPIERLESHQDAMSARKGDRRASLRYGTALHMRGVQSVWFAERATEIDSKQNGQMSFLLKSFSSIVDHRHL